MQEKTTLAKEALDPNPNLAVPDEYKLAVDGRGLDREIGKCPECGGTVLQIVDKCACLSCCSFRFSTKELDEIFLGIGVEMLSDLLASGVGELVHDFGDGYSKYKMKLFRAENLHWCVEAKVVTYYSESEDECDNGYEAQYGEAEVEIIYAAYSL